MQTYKVVTAFELHTYDHPEDELIFKVGQIVTREDLISDLAYMEIKVFKEEFNIDPSGQDWCDWCLEQGYIIEC